MSLRLFLAHSSQHLRREKPYSSKLGVGSSHTSIIPLPVRPELLNSVGYPLPS